MQNPELGKIIPDGAEAHRDAIHIAITPMLSNEKLYPGQSIGLNSDGLAVEANDKYKALGIVDPFLDHIIMPHTRFWMLLFPRTITSLRHEWTHTDFDKTVNSKFEAEKYLRDIAKQTNTPFETLITALNNHDTILAEEGSYDHINDEEFSKHVKNYLGKNVVSQPFRCSC